MSTFWTIFLIVLAILLIVVIVLYFLGRKVQKRQSEQEEQIAATKQTVSMLIIDKKKMRLKDAGLPAMVIENTPKLLRRTKMPVVKGKVGPQIMTFLCDAKVFDIIPVKKEVKATVSGLYIVGVKGIRGSLDQPKDKKKQSKFSKFKEDIQKKAGAKPL
ncbi:MAG: hypothetical protein K5989_07025 [Lachnospiraceae bacterium]|nr:hypothetical protein [Lachnospiraceae bacterium]